MKKTLRKILSAGAVGLSSLLPIKKTEAQVKGNVEYIQSEKPENSYARVNAFYNLPTKINGYTFLEFYQNNGGYYGRTILDRGISNGIGPRLVGSHSGGEILKEVGIGVSAVVPGLPKKTFARVSFVPIWISPQGRKTGDNALIQYFVSTDLPKGFSISSFGEWDVLAGEKTVQWGYGEIELNKRVGKFKIGYVPALLNNGDASPRLEHRINVGVNF